MSIYFDKDYVSISYDANNHLLVASWKMPPLSSEFRTYMEALISAMEHFETGKLIADTTRMGTLSLEDQEWSSKDWTRRAIEVGYSHVAILLPTDVFSQMAIEDTMNGMVGPVAFSYFENMEDALIWMKSVGVNHIQQD